jgi:hypothetical protein
MKPAIYITLGLIVFVAALFEPTPIGEIIAVALITKGLEAGAK